MHISHIAILSKSEKSYTFGKNKEQLKTNIKYIRFWQNVDEGGSVHVSPEQEFLLTLNLLTC
jgi:hypothetical protein